MKCSPERLSSVQAAVYYLYGEDRDAQFEAAVPHIDVEECPEHSLGRPAFCRASAGGDLVHVFFFDTNGEQCLLKLQSYGEDAFELQIKRE